MEKLTRILAVADGINDGALVLGKSVALARRFGAHIELLLFNTIGAREFATLYAELAYEKVTLASMHQGSESLTEAILRRREAKDSGYPPWVGPALCCTTAWAATPRAGLTTRRGWFGRARSANRR